MASVVTSCPRRPTIIATGRRVVAYWQHYRPLLVPHSLALGFLRVLLLPISLTTALLPQLTTAAFYCSLWSSATGLCLCQAIDLCMTFSVGVLAHPNRVVGVWCLESRAWSRVDFPDSGSQSLARDTRRGVAPIVPRGGFIA